jgi:hypothetical protein
LLRLIHFREAHVRFGAGKVQIEGLVLAPAALPLALLLLTSP